MSFRIRFFSPHMHASSNFVKIQMVSFRMIGNIIYCMSVIMHLPFYFPKE